VSSHCSRRPKPAAVPSDAMLANVYLPELHDTCSDDKT